MNLEHATYILHSRRIPVSVLFRFKFSEFKCKWLCLLNETSSVIGSQALGKLQLSNIIRHYSTPLPKRFALSAFLFFGVSPSY